MRTRNANDLIFSTALPAAENGSENTVRSASKSGARTVVIAGGGTSGHVNPALAIAQALKEQRPDLDILFVGTADGLESELVPAAGFAFHAIPAYPFFRNSPRAWLRALREFREGRRLCIELLRERRACAVVGTGGYVSGPLLSAAKKLALPRLLHEQNAFPGSSNRMMSRGADVVCISYEASAKYFNKARRIVLSGNPVKAQFFQVNKQKAREELAIPQDRLLILATGGSLGARSINHAVLELAALLRHKQEAGTTDLPAHIILACGQARHNECLDALEKAGLVGYDGLKIEKYLYNMVMYMAAADIIISRAGAIACAEMAALAKASLLVPYPHATGDHQRFNAEVFVKQGAALSLDDRELNGQSLEAALHKMLHPSETLRAMERAAATLARPEAAAEICRELLALIRD